MPKDNNYQPRIVNPTEILFNEKNKIYFQIKTEKLCHKQNSY